MASLILRCACRPEGCTMDNVEVYIRGSPNLFKMLFSISVCREKLRIQEIKGRVKKLDLIVFRTSGQD